MATLAFESPILIIEKLIFNPKKKPELNNADEQTRNHENHTDIKLNGQTSTQF